MKTFEINDGEKITFLKKYYIIQGNNGNHSGHNRQWAMFSEGFATKKDANKAYRDAANENADIKYGLTPLRIVTPEEIVEILESSERLNPFTCFDIQ